MKADKGQEMQSDKGHSTSLRSSQGNHTPGPWHVGTEVDSDGHVVYINVETHAGKVSCVGVYGHKANGKTAGVKYVDKFGNERHKPFISEAEARANARLIAAAPELLEALQKIAGLALAPMVDMADPAEERARDWSHVAATAWEIARAALSKVAAKP